jgi:hypothetical protein
MTCPAVMTPTESTASISVDERVPRQPENALADLVALDLRGAAGAMVSSLVLMHRGMSIAGGTSEIKRNQIGERILGLPRDPLIN